MKILFLYAEVTGYLMACLHALAQHPQVTALCVYEGLQLQETDFRLDRSAIPIRDATRKSADGLWPEIQAFAPDVVFVSGWMFRKYHTLARRLRRTGATLVIGNDTPWYGTARQWLGAASSPLWLRNTYHYMWVPGTFQYEFARRLGFSKKRIATGLLSADVESFSGKTIAREKPVKTLLSVGSFLPNKGMHRLYRAFSGLLDEGLAGWELHLVGARPLHDDLPNRPGIRITAFQQPEAVPEIFLQADAFALASVKESWGVVVHEAACAGLPRLVTETAGAVADFVHDRYNGFLFDPRDEGQLQEKMRLLCTLPEEELHRMGRRSHGLSRVQHPELWAQKLVNMRLDHLAQR